MRSLLLILSAIAFLFTTATKDVQAGPGDEETQELNWLKYHEALEKGRKENRHILVNFSTSWCGYCKIMDSTTYRDSGVVATLNEYYALALVDGDSYDLVKLADGDITEKGLTRQFGVRGYPTTWLLEPDGTKIAPVRGYVNSVKMQYILDFIRTNANESMQFKDFVEQRLQQEQQSKEETQPQGSH